MLESLCRLSWLRIEVLWTSAFVDIEARWAGSDVELLALKADQINVQEVTLGSKDKLCT